MCVHNYVSVSSGSYKYWGIKRDPSVLFYRSSIWKSDFVEYVIDIILFESTSTLKWWVCYFVFIFMYCFSVDGLWPYSPLKKKKSSFWNLSEKEKKKKMFFKNPSSDLPWVSRDLACLSKPRTSSYYTVSYIHPLFTPVLYCLSSYSRCDQFLVLQYVTRLQFYSLEKYAFPSYSRCELQLVPLHFPGPVSLQTTCQLSLGPGKVSPLLWKCRAQYVL